MLKCIVDVRQRVQGSCVLVFTFAPVSLLTPSMTTRCESLFSARHHTIIYLITHGSEPDLLITSAGVKIIVPDVRAHSNVRALLVGTDE